MKLGDVDGSIAHAMETDVRLLPLLPELLADIWELGTSSEDVIAALQSAGAESGSTALDLGCGKGAVAVALAERLGLGVEGVDAFAPFLESARGLAKDRGVSSKCVFREGDIRQILARGMEDEEFDVVLLLSVGPLSGDHRKTVGDLRRLVRKGGLIVIDDGFLAGGVNELPHAEGYAGYDETLRRLTAWGDELVHEIVSSVEDTRAVNETNTELIRKRALELERKNPVLAPLIDEYVARQEHETRVFGSDMVCATWVLRRA
jgi:ubiquinone/menaquinone biosynthesis C-methylase UbiE